MEAGIALTTRQVARGELETNLANIFLNKFAKKYIFGEYTWLKLIVTCPPKYQCPPLWITIKKQAIFSNNILAN